MDERRPYRVAVIGGSRVSEKIYKLAYETGKELARSGFIVYNGGKAGVMEASAAGVKDAGGVVVGILPEDNAEAANRYVDIPVATGMGIGRNIVLVRSVDGVIAIDGSYGTLSEIALAAQSGKPIVGLQTWDNLDVIIAAESPQDAVAKLLSIL